MTGTVQEHGHLHLDNHGTLHAAWEIPLHHHTDHTAEAQQSPLRDTPVRRRPTQRSGNALSHAHGLHLAMS